MTRLAFYSLLSFLLASPAWANDVVSCDPTHVLVPNAVTRFEKAVDFPETPGFLVWIAPNNSMTPAKQTYMNTLRGQIDSLSGIPHRYWLCTDTNPVDGVLDSVTEMSQAQKDAMDQPDKDAQAKSDALDLEVSTNDFCSGELADVKAAVDAQIDSWVTARQAEVNATTNFATLKATLRDQTIPAIGQAMKVGLKKTVGCIKGRLK